MKRVKIITDSCAFISPEVAEDLDIEIIPLTIGMADDVLFDGDSATHARYFELQARGIRSTVSAPSVETFEQAYAKLYQETDQILALHVSAGLSSTYANSVQGADALRGRCNIEVVDSNSILLGEGILVQLAAEAARDGKSLDEIVRLVRGLVPHVYTVLFVDTMDYLERSGTVGKAQAVLGTMMQIKPLLFMEDGKIVPMEKVKSVEKAVDKLAEFVAEFDTIEQTAIIQSDTVPTEQTNMLLQRLEQLFPDKPFPIIQYNPLLASYVGPRAMGIIVYEGMTAF